MALTAVDLVQNIKDAQAALNNLPQAFSGFMEVNNLGLEIRLCRTRSGDRCRCSYVVTWEQLIADQSLQWIIQQKAKELDAWLDLKRKAMNFKQEVTSK